MIKNDERVLNIGCGNETYGTDFVDLYPSRDDILKIDIQSEKLPYLEHCMNPGNVISEMYRVLKKGGKLIIITDNANYWGYSLRNSLHRGGYEKNNLEDKHYVLFTDWHLKNFSKKNNFKKIEIKYLKEFYDKQNKIKYFIKLVINSFLKITPFDKMAFMRIQFIGEK